jgi:hypothetical protein
MWANWETVALAEWLRGIMTVMEIKLDFGLDVYSLWESLMRFLNI